ncbi:CLUMA_CG017411, isoform A [Clunio marinus]|uniref:CLUMA_CG017411, isoform A n=1 Tax=Clunio marinus TaxID=568069 RepID=A0A1J1IVL9_9DIPT|nr:CLUMA_CG017411, isoform A [Clunio marinus]
MKIKLQSFRMHSERHCFHQYCSKPQVSAHLHLSHYHCGSLDKTKKDLKSYICLMHIRIISLKNICIQNECLIDGTKYFIPSSYQVILRHRSNALSESKVKASVKMIEEFFIRYKRLQEGEP